MGLQEVVTGNQDLFRQSLGNQIMPEMVTTPLPSANDGKKSSKMGSARASYER